MASTTTIRVLLLMAPGGLASRLVYSSREWSGDARDGRHQPGTAFEDATGTSDAADDRDGPGSALQHHRSQPIPPLERLVHVRDRNYGTTRLTFFRYI